MSRGGMLLGVGLAVAAAAAVGLWVWRRGGIGPAAQAIGAGAVQAVQGAAVGAVKGIGQAVGIPDTNDTACQRALAAGDTWRASFDCPAGTFIGAMWDRATGAAPPPVDQSVMDRWDYAARAGSSSNGQAGDRSFDDLAGPDAWLPPPPSGYYAP